MKDQWMLLEWAGPIGGRHVKRIATGAFDKLDRQRLELAEQGRTILALVRSGATHYGGGE